MIKSVIMTLLAASAAAAIAQAPGGTPATTKVGPNGNPDQIICRNEAEIGSRLSRRRVCRTRAEWAEHRAQYKQNIERAQTQSYSAYVDPPLN